MAKIYDASVLDKETDFTLSVDIPKEFDVPLNPDGTRPQISLHAEGATLRAILLGLEYLHNNDEMVMDAILQSLVTEEEFATATNEDLLAKLQENQNPFLTVDLSLDVSFGDDETAQPQITLVAPSGITAIDGFGYLASKKNLDGAFFSHLPDEEDEDGDEYY